MRRIALVALLGTALGSSPALSAGWDTPILYSAEHMGMGGAAIGFVDDPSAVVLNPAGLAQTQGLTLMANTSLLLGTITSSPTPEVINEESEPIRAVVPLLAASYKLNDWIAAGLAFYPVASAGAVYNYESDGDAVENSTDVLFLEISPSLAFELPGDLRLGIGYRISYVSLTRVLKPSLAPLDFALTGWNLEGLRVGLQWAPSETLELGLVYRHKTETEITDDSAVVLSPVEAPAKSVLVLPSKLGFGLRANLDPIALVLDVEYTFQDQNDELIVERDPALILVVNNVFRWKNTITVRGGVEYDVNNMYFFRGGFIYDGQATQEKWPSAFGTPPAPSTTITGGFGYKPADGPWDFNLALAYRIATATVTQEDVDAGSIEHDCLACSKAGDYKLGLFGAYADFTYSFD